MLGLSSLSNSYLKNTAKHENSLYSAFSLIWFRFQCEIECRWQRIRSGIFEIKMPCPYSYVHDFTQLLSHTHIHRAPTCSLIKFSAGRQLLEILNRLLEWLLLLIYDTPNVCSWLVSLSHLFALNARLNDLISRPFLEIHAKYVRKLCAHPNASAFYVLSYSRFLRVYLTSILIYIRLKRKRQDNSNIKLNNEFWTEENLVM